MTCTVCDEPFEESSLQRCPMCHKMFCERCERNKGGKRFCSQNCAEFFYHYEEEDEA